MKSTFAKDLKAEKIVGTYLDRYFYPKVYGDEFQRIHDKANQIKGIDVLLPDMKIDEKAQIKYVNAHLPTQAFELSWIGADKTERVGWFLDKGKETTHYVLCDITAKKEKNFSFEDITKMKVFVINRKELIAALHKRMSSFEKAAEDIRKRGESGRFAYSTTLPFYYFFSTWFPEKPINLIIKKDFLGNGECGVVYSVTPKRVTILK